MWVVLRNDIKVGFGNFPNEMIFAYLIEKPWNHIAAFATGVYFAHLYCRLLKYRRCLTDMEKQSDYRIIDYSVKSLIPGTIMMIAGTAILITDLFCVKPELTDPGFWTALQTAFYFGMTRSTFALSAWLNLFPLFFSNPKLAFMREM